jgi:glycosyltransferase involved in cell wall biosynthesis
LAKTNPSVKAIIFRGSFGQSAAMAAGFKYTKGQVIVSMDGDLQNDLVINHHARQFGKLKYDLSRTFQVIMDLIPSIINEISRKSAILFWYN